MKSHIIIGTSGIELGNWGTESADSVLDRFAEYVAAQTCCSVELGDVTNCDGTNFDPVDVDVTLWGEFCAQAAEVAP